MSRTHGFSLSAEQQAELTRLRDHHPKPYLRERAAALLKVAAGAPIAHVAAHGLLRPRDEETVSAWIARYRQQGVAGLGVRPGRGRKPASAQNHATPAAAAAELREIVHRSPRLFGLPQSRWTLAALTKVVAWMALLTCGGVHRILRRLSISYRRGQRHVHSPDLEYEVKVKAIAAVQIEVRATPERKVLLYQDEMTYYRRPTVAQAYVEVGGPGLPAEQGHGSNKKRRIIGSLNVVTGQLFTWQRAHADVPTLIRYYRAVEAAYPAAETIYIAQDNWPVHFLPEVLEALRGTRIQLLRLPTYAPWTNPIEKVWRKLYQEILHQHEFRDRWAELQTTVQAWLQRWANGSMELLHYVGLNPD
jgi:transposase